jgi:integrase
VAKKKSFHGAGYVRSYETKGGQRWRYQIRVPVNPDLPELGTRPVTKNGFLTEKDATRAKDKAIQDAERGLRVGAEMPTLAAYAETWLAGLDLASATRTGYHRQLHRHILPRIGKLPLDKVLPTTLKKLYADLAVDPPAPTQGRWSQPKPLGPNSIHKIAVTMGSLLGAAVSDGLIATNPTLMKKTVRPPSLAARKAAKPEMTVWTEQQLESFLLWLRDTLADSEYPLWKLYAASGARRSEILALRWTDIDLRAGKLHIRRTLDTDDPDPSAVKPPKNGEARSLTLSPSAVVVLRQWRRLLASRDLNAVKPGAWVFPFDKDWSRPRNPQSVSEMFTRRVTWARAALGEDKLPTLHLHGIRHTVVTLLIESGLDHAKVAKRVGHSSPAITLAIYTHATAKGDDAAAAVLDFG